MRFSFFSAVLVFAAFLAVAQQQSNQQQSNQQQNNQQQNQQQQNQQGAQKTNTPAEQGGTNTTAKPANNDKPAPLFQGTIGLRSSRQTKDSATLGFNGVGPNGQVEHSFLQSSPSESDKQKAAFVASIASDPAELLRFLKEGNLNPNAPAPQKGASAK